jgi:recombination associated protein RdgC
LLQLRTQSRVLPIAAIREELESRVSAYRQRTGDEPNRGQLRKLKEETRDELLPKSLLKSERTRGLVLPKESILVIDAASAGKAEWFIDQLRPCFARLQCVPLTFNTRPDSLLKKMFLGDVPKPFSLGNECRLQDPADRLSIGAFRNIDLDDKTVRQHVLDGMRLTHLGLGFDEYASFVLSEDAVISKLKFLKGDAADELDDEDPQARMDADFVLLAGTFRRIIKELRTHLGGLVPVDTSTL